MGPFIISECLLSFDVIDSALLFRNYVTWNGVIVWTQKSASA